MGRIKPNNLVAAFVSSVITLLLLSLCCTFLFLAYIDLHYFTLEKQVRTWSQRHPPTNDQVQHIQRKIDQLWRKKNPNLLWLEAIVYEWQAHLDDDNHRFYLIKSESGLRQAIGLRPKDARLWAHLAIIMDKQRKPDDKVQAAVKRALSLGGTDLATHNLLQYFHRTDQLTRE